MERILLVEPNYYSKYPPLGLMKIATYHRRRSDVVEFYKGEAPYAKVILFDRVYIASLFTFHYDIIVKCIKHYLKFVNKSSIFLGGAAATLLTSEFYNDTGIENIVRGLLTDSSMIGYDDKINIDLLPIDYDILDDVSYNYPSGDNYFIHTTRGCKRDCPFCAVKTLEPEFVTTNHVIEQVTQINDIFGEKDNLIVMDNNVLSSDILSEIVSDIHSLGFTGAKDYIPPNPFNVMMSKIRRRILNKTSSSKQVEELLQYLLNFSKRLERNKNVQAYYNELVSSISQNECVWTALQNNKDELSNLTEKYRAKTRKIRYVDFNQGIDARLVNEQTAKTLAKIPIRPFRLAFDSINDTASFTNATKTVMAHGVKELSSYVLYNWEDKPEDLWVRLNITTSLYGGKCANPSQKVKGFSFPMKYAPIFEKDRSYVGIHWNRKYLSALNVILNVTKGIVARERDFFYEAFGKSANEFIEILTMPDELIRHRHFFRNNGLLDFWRNLYDELSVDEKNQLLDILIASKKDRKILHNEYPIKLRKILETYKINKSQFDRGETDAKFVTNTIAEMH